MPLCYKTAVANYVLFSHRIVNNNGSAMSRKYLQFQWYHITSKIQHTKQIYKKQFNNNSLFNPFGYSLFNVWIQKASLWSNNRSLSPPLLGAFTTSIPWNLSVHMSCLTMLKCLAIGDFWPQPLRTLQCTVSVCRFRRTLLCRCTSLVPGVC